MVGECFDGFRNHLSNQDWGLLANLPICESAKSAYSSKTSTSSKKKSRQVLPYRDVPIVLRY